MSADYYKSTFSNKKLAILNIVLLLFYLLYLAAFVWFCTDFFINTYSTEFNTTTEIIGFFLLICSITCICPIIISLCRILFNTLKKRWIIYTPQTSYLRRRIEGNSEGIKGSPGRDPEGDAEEDTAGTEGEITYQVVDRIV